MFYLLVTLMMKGSNMATPCLVLLEEKTRSNMATPWLLPKANFFSTSRHHQSEQNPCHAAIS
jgi:hypothetical protein